MLAIIRTGGKQYKISPGDKIKVDKIDKAEGKEISFSDVLLLAKDKQVEIGQPKLKEIKVIAKILKQAKDKKIIVFKYKAKKRYQKKQGFRRQYTELEILKIETN